MRFLFLTLFLFFSYTSIFSQDEIKEKPKFYSISSSEIIFAWSDAQFNYDSEFFLTNPNSEISSNNLRFSMFFHLTQHWHYDFTRNVGMITGLGLRNVGMSTNERHDFIGNDNILEDYKFMRRSYLLGLPMAIKVGSFDDHLYVYGGAEFEIAFHYKQKYWESHQRSGGKKIDKQWFGNQTKTILPSVFFGVQFPKGINMNVKYYLSDFLNPSYSPNEIHDFSRYAKTQIVYLSVSLQVYSEKVRDRVKRDEVITSL